MSGLVRAQDIDFYAGEPQRFTQILEIELRRFAILADNKDASPRLA
jgi:hypothetical protein